MNRNSEKLHFLILTKSPAKHSQVLPHNIWQKFGKPHINRRDAPVFLQAFLSTLEAAMLLRMMGTTNLSFCNLGAVGFQQVVLVRDPMYARVSPARQELQSISQSEIVNESKSRNLLKGTRWHPSVLRAPERDTPEERKRVTNGVYVSLYSRSRSSVTFLCTVYIANFVSMNE